MSILQRADSRFSGKMGCCRQSYVLRPAPLSCGTSRTAPLRQAPFAGIREWCRAVPCRQDDFQASTTFPQSRHIPLVHLQLSRPAPVLRAAQCKAGNYFVHAGDSKIDSNKQVQIARV